MSSSARQKVARIALGDGAISNPGFYSSLHQDTLKDKYIHRNREKDQIESSLDTEDFRGTQWDLIRVGAYDTYKEQPTNQVSPDVEETCKMIDFVAEDFKKFKRFQRDRGYESILHYCIRDTKPKSAITTTLSFPQAPKFQRVWTMMYNHKI